MKKDKNTRALSVCLFCFVYSIDLQTIQIWVNGNGKHYSICLITYVLGFGNTNRTTYTNYFIIFLQIVNVVKFYQFFRKTINITFLFINNYTPYQKFIKYFKTNNILLENGKSGLWWLSILLRLLACYMVLHRIPISSPNSNTKVRWLFFLDNL